MDEDLQPLDIVDNRPYAQFVAVDAPYEIAHLFRVYWQVKGLSADGDEISLPAWMKRYWNTHKEASIVVWLLNILAVGKSKQDLDALTVPD